MGKVQDIVHEITYLERFSEYLKKRGIINRNQNGKFYILHNNVWREIVLSNDLELDLKKLFAIIRPKKVPTFVSYEAWSSKDKKTALCEEYIIDYNVFAEEEPA